MHDHEQLPEAAEVRSKPAGRATEVGPALQRALEGGSAHALDPAALLQLQRAAGNDGVGAFLQREEDDPSSVHAVVGSGGGTPLDAGTRSFMEDRLGQDFSDVRVHSDDEAAASARSVNASAYTVGDDVVFGE